MKTLITLLFLSVATFGYAQLPDTTPSSDRIEAKADDLIAEYNSQLALTSVQLPLFRNVVEDYLQKSEAAKQRYTGREQLDALLELQIDETLKMGNILTSPQYDVYKKIKLKLQPLKTVKQ